MNIQFHAKLCCDAEIHL